MFIQILASPFRKRIRKRQRKGSGHITAKQNFIHKEMFSKYCWPINAKSRFEPIAVQWIQTKIWIPSPHARMCEGYFSVSTASGGLSIMADNDSSQSFSGCSRNPCTSVLSILTSSWLWTLDAPWVGICLSSHKRSSRDISLRAHTTLRSCPCWLWDIEYSL